MSRGIRSEQQEQRSDLLLHRLVPLFEEGYSRDQAGSLAVLLATLISRLEPIAARQIVRRAPVPADRETILAQLRTALDSDLSLLPAYLDEQRAFRSRDALLACLLRFISGERPGRAEGAPALARDELASLARQARLRELARRGVDLTLLQQTLRLSPTERVERMLSLGHFLDAVQAAAKHTAP